MPATRFDSSQFAYADMSVQIGARVITGLRGVRYKEAQEKEFVYGKGVKPLAIQAGNIAYEGELMLLQNELELLIQAAPRQSLLNSRDVIVTITYGDATGLLITDRLTGVEFTEVEKGMNQNDKFREVTLPIMFLNLQLNIAN